MSMMLRWTVAPTCALLMLLTGCGEGEVAADAEAAGSDVDSATTATTPQPGAEGRRAAQPERPAPSLDEDELARLPVDNSRPIAVTPAEVDFGTVRPGTANRHVFTIANRQSEPVTVVKATPTCHCTTLDELTGKVIAAGGSLEMPAELKAPVRPGEKSATIIVMLRTGDVLTQRRVDLKAQVEMAVRAEPPYVEALRGVTSGQLAVESVDGRPFEILSSNGAEPDLVGYTPGRDAPRNRYLLRWSIADWDCSPPDCQPCGKRRLWWILETDHPDAPILPVRIRNECTGARSDPLRHDRGWFFSELLVNAGAIRAGEPVTLTLNLNNPDGIAVDGAESLNPQATAELVEVRRASELATEVDIKFTPASDYEGMLYAQVMVHSPTGSHWVPVAAKVER